MSPIRPQEVRYCCCHLLCERNGNVSSINVDPRSTSEEKPVLPYTTTHSMIKPSLDPEAECRLWTYMVRWGWLAALEIAVAILLSDFDDFQSRFTASARHIHGTV